MFSPRNLFKLASGRVPGQLIIQMTDACNARCPQCEMRVTHRYRRNHLDSDGIREALDAAARQGMAAVSFTGGEPFLDVPKLLGLLQYASDLGIPLLRTGTNAFFLRHHEHPEFESRVTELAGQLTATRLRNLWFSIDSADPEVHETMRGLPGVIEGMAKALPIFHRHGLWPTANLGINRNLGGEPLLLPLEASERQRQDFAKRCRQAFENFFQKVVAMGFTIVNFCYPMSVESEPEKGLGAIYRASSADQVVRFRREEKALLFAALGETVAAWRHRIRIFSPRSMLHSLAHHYRTGEEHGYGCRGGLDFYFLGAADGNAYPCGFRADENLGKLADLDFKSRGREETCTRCDWECFRDPSNLTGPILELTRAPLTLARRLRGDRRWTRLWFEDLRYQRACHFFDGRRAPDPKRLAGFGPRAEGEAAPAARARQEAAEATAG